MNIKLIKECNKFDIEIMVLKGLKKIDKSLKKVFKDVGFTAKEGESFFYQNALFIGTNKLKDEDIKIAFSNAVRVLKKTNYKTIKISLLVNDKELNLKEVSEGLLLGVYSFEKYKSKQTKVKQSIVIEYADCKKTKAILEKELRDTKNICEAVNLARDVINTTPEDFFPKSFTQMAEELALKDGLECKIYGEDYLKESKMNAMLAVGRASRHESQLIHLSHKPKNSKGKIVLVGKGLTYDSGGLSLKSGAGMVSMKCDKSGGSAVLAVMSTIAKLDLDVEVHGIIGAVENMIGGDAYKPDDVLVARNGVSIEVRNTDAEGRLVLADCLCYAQDEIKDFDCIFDIATLTGACMVALGEYTTGVMGHSDKLKAKMQKAADQSGELIGILPYNRYLPQMIKSSIADITNSASSRMGGAITASMFLDNFIEKKNKKKWLHLDIAGAAYREKAWAYNAFGGTGAGVRLFLKFIDQHSKTK